MAKIQTRVTFNKKRAVAKVKAASKNGLFAMGNQALNDITQYVPRDQGMLESSGISNSDLEPKRGKITLMWSTPYAQYLWHGDVMYGNPNSRTYGPEKLTFTKALAREEWAKYAKEVHGEEWKQVYQAEIKRRLAE